MANECLKCQTNNPNESKFYMECAAPLPEAKEVVHTKIQVASTDVLTETPDLLVSFRSLGNESGTFKML
jgi:hypothetical protein